MRTTLAVATVLGFLPSLALAQQGSLNQGSLNRVAPGQAKSAQAPLTQAPISRGLNATGAVPTTSTTGGGVLPVGTSLNILVYSQDTLNSFAETAAQNVSPGGTTVAGSINFNSELTSQVWDVVAVDCPNAIPVGGWTDLINYVHGGGAAILSFWDWDDSSSSGDPNLPAAFDVSVSSTFTLGTSFLTSLGSPAFLGVSVPVSDWSDNFTDDGDEFNTIDGSTGIATLNGSANPCMVRGNGGRTIASFVLDEAGPTWLGDGSGIRIWENMIQMVGLGGPDVLVYDDDSLNSLAMRAAFESSPGGTRGAISSNFDDRLTAGNWDAVLMDMPNTQPQNGWNELTSFVNGGGHAVLSFWDWDSSSTTSDPTIPGTFDVSVAQSFSWSGNTLNDSGTTDVFAGVTMPNADWADVWLDDGDELIPLGNAAGLGHIGNPSTPVMVWGNAGRTIAAPVFDEAGSTWLVDGKQLWSNMLAKILGPKASCVTRTGVLGLNPTDYKCVEPPVVGGLWVAGVDTTPTVGSATLTTFVTMGLGGPIQGFPIFGYELLILPPYLETTSFGTHNIPVPTDPLLIGQTFPTQGARLEVSGTNLIIVLLNGQDVTFGL